jgi:hypothetical protein
VNTSVPEMTINENVIEPDFRVPVSLPFSEFEIGTFGFSRVVNTII